MFALFLVAALTWGELQNVYVGSGIQVRWPSEPAGSMTLDDPLGRSLAQDAVTADDRVSLTITFGPQGGADVEDVRVVRMLPGQKQLRVHDVSASLDAAALQIVNSEQVGQLRLQSATLLLPGHTAPDILSALVGESVEVMMPGGPLGFDRLEGRLLSAGEPRVVAVGKDLHVLSGEPLVFPGGMEKALSAPTLDVQLEQQGAARQIALRYPMRGASLETRYLLQLQPDGLATLTQRMGIYLARGTNFDEATINFYLREDESGFAPMLRRERVRLRESQTVWETYGVWGDLSVKHPEPHLTVLEGAVDSWLPAGTVTVQQVNSDGVTWTRGTTNLEQTAPGAPVVLMFPGGGPSTEPQPR